MKKLIFALLIIVLIGADSVSAKETKSETTTDIRNRAIIYFYPQTKLPTETEFAKYFTGFEPVKELPEKTTKPVITYSILNDFKELYPVPPIDYLAYSGRGMSKAQAESIQKSKQLLLIDVAYPKTQYLTGYKPFNNFLYEIASTHKGLIWDSETRELFEPGAWQERRITSWKEETPNIANHITIHAYNNDPEGIRAITLGMAKFGFPDIVVNNFSWSLNNPMGNLINLTAQSVFEGASPNDDDTLTLNISKLKNTAMRQNLQNGLKQNAAPELKIEIKEGKWEEGDPYNPLIELVFDSAEGKDLSEKQETTVSTLFGWEDSITHVKHDEEILAASKRTKAKLGKLRKDFKKGLEPGEYILLKAPFKTDDDGNEWMWVEVTSWKKTKIKGLLKNEPYFVSGLRAGSIVEISQDDVFDYIREYADGRSEGNETGEIMQRAK